MKRVRSWFIFIWIGLLVTGLSLNPAPVGAINLDFNVFGPDGIFVDLVKGMDTPLHNGEVLTIAKGELEFKTGNLTGSSATWFDFGGGPGSFITITGGIPVLGIPDGTALLSGTFAGGLFTYEKNPTLMSYFGFGGEGWSGNFNIRFIENSLQPGGDINSVVPEPTTILLLGLGLVGLAGFAKRKFRK